MEPVTLIVTALALGAAAGLQDSATAAVKDAYDALKGLLGKVYRGSGISELERKPESTPKRDSLEEDLREVGAGSDPEILKAAEALVAEVERHRADVPPALGVDLKQVRAEFLQIRSVKSTGTGVRVQEAGFSGGIDIGDVEAGRVDPR